MVERSVELEGVYEAGFEMSSFTPCDGFAELRHSAYGAGGTAWVDFEDGFPDLPEGRVSYYNGYRYESWFLRIQGTMTGPGSYGHLGIGRYNLTVDSVLESRPADEGGCGSELPDA